MMRNVKARRRASTTTLTSALLLSLLCASCDKLGLGGKDDEGGETAGDDKAKKAKKDKDKDKDKDQDEGGDDAETAKGPSEKVDAPEMFQDKVFKVGETAELAGLDMTITEVKDCAYEDDSRNQSLAKAGERLIGAHVEVKATSERTHVANAFRAHDADQVLIRSVGLNNTACKPPFASTTLLAGEKAKGWVGFKVPKDTPVLTMRIEYQPPRAKGEKAVPPKQVPNFALVP